MTKSQRIQAIWYALWAVVGVLWTSAAFADPDISETIVGRDCPARTSTDFLRFAAELEYAVTVEECPITRGTVYYFADDGSDAAAGTQAAPKQTIAEAQEILDASDGGDAILFKRGDVWETTVGLDVPSNADNCTIAAWGTGNLPYFDFFTTNFAASGWSQAGSTNRYTRTAAAPGDFREQLKPLKAYRKVASTAEVESTQNSYYHDGTTLHVHIANDAGTSISPNTVATECTLASTTDDSGIDIETGATGVRIDSLEIHGPGIDGGSTNQEYAFKSQVTGTDIACITNCHGYRQARHNMGHNPGSGASGGFNYWGSDVCGYDTEVGAAPFVFYCGGGGQEDWCVGCTTAYGALPVTASRNFADGMAVIAHTNSDSTPPAFICVIGHQIPAPSNGFGCHQAVVINNLPHEEDDDAKNGVIIGTRMPAANGTGSNGTTGHTLAVTGTLEIGSYYEFKLLDSPVDSMGSFNPRGSVYNTAMVFDLNHSGMTEGWMSIANPSSTTDAKWRFNHFHVKSNGTTDFAPLYDNNFSAAADATVALSDGTEMSNCIFSVERPNPASTADVIRPALRNAGATQFNNAYFGVSADGTYVGISNASNSLTLGALPVVLSQPTASSPLVGRGTTATPLDFYRRQRSQSATTIGPVEYIPSEMINPTLIEIADQVAATLGTPVSADVVDDSRTWFATDYRARNIVSINENFEGTLALQPDINPGSAIASVSSVTITGAATVTATELTTNRARTRAQFTVPALTTAGTYTVTVTVTTTDSQTIPTTATLKVQ